MEPGEHRPSRPRCRGGIMENSKHGKWCKGIGKEPDLYLLPGIATLNMFLLLWF